MGLSARLPEEKIPGNSVGGKPLQPDASPPPPAVGGRSIRARPMQPRAVNGSDLCRWNTFVQ